MPVAIPFAAGRGRLWRQYALRQERRPCAVPQRLPVHGHRGQHKDLAVTHPWQLAALWIPGYRRTPARIASSRGFAAENFVAAAAKVCAESWEDQDLLDSCVECVTTWRQWHRVRHRHLPRVAACARRTRRAGTHGRAYRRRQPISCRRAAARASTLLRSQTDCLNERIGTRPRFSLQ